MQKRALTYLIFSLLLISIFSINTLAQENSQDGENNLQNDLEDGFDDEEDEFDDENNLEEEFDEDITDERDTSENEEKTDESEEDIVEELEEEFGDDVELEESAGTTPDSAFYGIDNFFDENFGDPERVREEKFAEVREMLKNGNDEDARIALERYKKYADEFENDADPAKREEARRSSAAIRRIAKEEFKDEFSEDILEKEKNLVTAVEIASKIKDLCTELAKLDPSQFHKTCKTENDSPKWQKDLFDDLTEEQKKEAEKFIEVISNCFENPANCKCEESTNIESFVEQCKLISEAEAKCREGEETACDIADETGEEIFESLSGAPHLQEALEMIEKKFNDFEGDRFEDHMPPECREKNAQTSEECMQIMFRENAPEECIEALDNGEIKFTNEREARKACEEIMFRENAPEECIEAGLKDHKECGKYMFQQNAPQECIDAGLTGENRNDPRKCEELMREFEGEFEEDNRGQNRGPGREFNFDCGKIQNSEERLKCFDSAIKGFEDNRGPGDFGDHRSFDERFKETKEKEKQCAESCSQKGGAWDFSNGKCECRIEEREEFRERFDERRDFRPPQEQFDQPPQQFQGEPPQEFQNPPSQQEPQQSPPTSSESASNSGESSDESSSGGETSGSSSGESGSSGSGESSGITGSIIFDNEFFDYYYS